MLRRRAVQRRVRRQGDGRARPRQFPSAADQADATGRQFLGRHLAQRNADGQPARRGQIPAQPDGARPWLQSRAYRRRFGRNPGRLRPLPPRHAAVQLGRPGSEGGRAVAGRIGRKQRGVARRAACPAASRFPMESVRRTLGFVPSWLEVRSSNTVRYRRLLRPEFLAEFADRDPSVCSSIASTFAGSSPGASR